MKEYGDVVSVVRGPDTANALVVQSVPQQDGEHLVVFFLDPSHKATALSGQSVDAAITKGFVTPLTEGKTFGWKELPEPVLPTGGEPSDAVGYQGTHWTDEEIGKLVSDTKSKALSSAAETINQQADKITELQKANGDLSAELEGVKTELATTTEGIDKQLQGIADATAAKEAAPKATALQNVVAENIQVPGSEPSEPDPSLEQGSVSTESLSSSESSTDLGSGEVQPSTAQDAPSPSLDSPSSDSSKESDTSTLEPQQ